MMMKLMLIARRIALKKGPSFHHNYVTTTTTTTTTIIITITITIIIIIIIAID